MRQDSKLSSKFNDDDRVKNPAAPAVRRRIEAEHQTDHQYKANED
jgi:hypothetical protein